MKPLSGLLVRSWNCYEWIILLVCMDGPAMEQEVGVKARVSIDQYESCTAACS